MTIALCMIMFFLLLIEIDLSHIYCALDRIATELKNVRR